MRVTINNQPYSFTRNAAGWRVVSLAQRTDRLHRSYQVYLGEDGRPLRCSCPRNVHAGVDCKHVREALRLWYAERPDQAALLRETAARCGLDLP